MIRKVSCLSLSSLLLAISFSAQAQQPKKIPRIGLLDLATPEAQSARNEAFRQGLRDLGYVEGKNIIIEYHSAEEKLDRLPHLVAELMRNKVKVIVAQSTPVARAAAQVTKTIPIVNAGGGDLIGSGLAATLAQPGGNVTGLTSLTRDLSVKRLELLKEIRPSLTRVAVLPSPIGSTQVVKEMKAAVTALQMELHVLDVKKADDLARAFEIATKGMAGAMIVTPDATGLFFANMKRLSALAIKTRLPIMCPSARYVNAGGLISYSADDFALWRRAATYVDKILKGAKPADLPVEQPMKFEFVVNLKAAKEIGFTIPPDVLMRADSVVR